jgi:hypothetical protein
MLKVHLIALGDGQSYDNATILNDSDYEAHDVPNLMEENTFAFVYNKKLILTHRYNIALVHYSREKPSIPNCIPFKRVTLVGNISYGPGNIVDTCNIEKYGLPLIFNKRNGELGQLTMITQEGILIASDYNVSNILLKNDHRPSIR